MVASWYHRILRISAAIVAVVLLFDSGVLVPESKMLSEGTWQYLANSVGVYATVPENEYNTITAELSEWEAALAAREAALEAREIPARDFGRTTDLSTYLLSTILFVLTVLIVLNYGLDWARSRRLNYERKAS